VLAGARVFPEAQPREWAAAADSSSEGLGNYSGIKVVGFLAYSSIALIRVQDTDLKRGYLCCSGSLEITINEKTTL
jgi:hypothetical protein